QEALVRDIDEARVEGRERRVTQAEALHRPALEVLAEYIGAGDELQDDLAAARIARIDCEAPLVAIEEGEESGAHAEQPSRVVAGQRLDLDHVGAEVGED